MSRADERTAWEIFNRLADEVTVGIEVVCHCCSKIYAPDGSCSCYIYMDEYVKIWTDPELSYKDQYSQSEAWKEKNMNNMPCSMYCSGEGIINDICRRCGTSVHVSEIACPNCVAMVIQRYGQVMLPEGV